MPVDKVRCVCGCIVGKSFLNKHKKTLKHQKQIDEIIHNDFYIIECNKPIIEIIKVYYISNN
jgi:hypothetical protein